MIIVGFVVLALMGWSPDLPAWRADVAHRLSEVGGSIGVVLTWAVEHLTILGTALGALLAVTVVHRLWNVRPTTRDPRRDYPSQVRREAFARAGDRCEYTSFPGLRCRRIAEHADHLHPWSRGGATTLTNAVASCARHNLAKSNHILPPWSIWALQQRRRRYFPPGTDVRAGERYKVRVGPA